MKFAVYPANSPQASPEIEKEYRRYLSNDLILNHQFRLQNVSGITRTYIGTVTIEELPRIFAILKHFFWWQAHDCYHPCEVVAV